MDSLLASVLSYVLIYRYAAIFIIEFFGAIILPLPVNAAMLAVGAFSSQGYFNLWGSLTAAVAGNVLGDLTDYLATRKFGEIVIKKLRINKSRFFLQLEEELRQDAVSTVFSSRFAGSLSSIVNFVAGFVGVPFFSFFIPDLLGDLIEPLVLMCVGYVLGVYWDNFSSVLTIFAAVVATGVIMFILFRMYRRMTKRRRESAETSDN
jgi:membrane protein DedA with SNARE-associated domain